MTNNENLKALCVYKAITLGVGISIIQMDILLLAL